MSIILVVSNLKHDGTDYKKGQFIDSEPSVFQGLINEGVLRVIDGAETVKEAEEILAEEVAAAGDEEVAAAPKDTWGAVPDAPEEVEEKKEEPKEEVAAAPKAEETKANDIAAGDTAPLDAAANL